MKVLFLALALLLSLTMTKSNPIDTAWRLLCKINVENPAKMSEVRKCFKQILSGKSELLLGAIQDCEKAKFPNGKLTNFFKEMCKDEREVDAQEVKECIDKKFVAAKVDPEYTLTEMIDNCF
ncbi:uncharacterized protein LOC143224120 [Tachypleus tridentatus]|uniref:uncharacterized protein LOC143224120 n=1 Tax=Tachypleus tridentatus TaxID=6853 RepID=UPI003FD3A0EF